MTLAGTMSNTVCVWGEFVSLDAHLGNGTGPRTATMTGPILLTSGLVRYEAVCHSFGTSLMGGRVLTCDSAQSWGLYSAASLEQQATGTIICYTTQLHYPDTETTSPCPMLIMPSARLGSDKYQF